MKKEWKVSAEYNGMRLQQYLGDVLDHSLSGKKIKALIDQGQCFINGKRERFSNRRVQTHQQIMLISHEEERIGDIEYIHEDEALCVINKPPGIVSDRELEKKIGGYLVHRLDKDTSGLLVFAKTKEAKENLYNQFRKKEVRKEYRAVCLGDFLRKNGKVKNHLFIKKRWHGQKIWAVSPSEKGVLAYTKYEVLSFKDSYSLVALYPITGKTHQLRLHMSSIGHPIVGDRLYGPETLSSSGARLFLHAFKVTFMHPITGEKCFFEAPLPEEFHAVCAF